MNAIRRPLALALLAGMPAALAPAQDQTLPVSSVTLYRSGVGAFERSGTVQGDATVKLDASADQIDDLLKSLVVLDYDGGRVGAVTYTADEPVARLLEALGVSSPNQLTLNLILVGFKGAEVTIEATGRGTIPGRILGADAVTTMNDNGSTTTRARVSLLGPSGIVTVHDDEIASITFEDEALRADFEALLAALAEQRTEQSRSLEIKLRGAGERRVSAVYTQETPVWKTSYRVMIPEDDDGTLRLQGWAIVENTTDSDWNDVSLSLVAGRPVGFTMPLSQPLYAPRPAVPVPVELAARPRTIAAGRDPEINRFDARGAGQNSLGLQRSVAGREAVVTEMADAVPASPGLSFREAAGAFVAGASSAESGEVFFYRLDDPVTVGRRQSAMIPILTEEITGRRVSISSPSDGIDHPMRGLEMTNTSDLKLMPGPVSVYDAAAFAGDAQIGYVGAGDDRMLAFGVDLDVGIERNTVNRRERIEKISFRDGVAIKTVFNQVVDRVTITNNDEQRGRTVILEINALEGWDLDSKTPLYESAPGVHRFEIGAGAGQDVAFEATQSRTSSTRIALMSFDLEQMIRYNRNGSVSDEVLAAFRGYAERRGAVDDLKKRIQGLDAETSRLAQDQERVRRLMGSLSRQDTLHGRYLRTLEQHEDRLEAIRTERTEASSQLAQRETELNEYVRSLNVE